MERQKYRVLGGDTRIIEVDGGELRQGEGPGILAARKDHVTELRGDSILLRNLRILEVILNDT